MNKRLDLLKESEFKLLIKYMIPAISGMLGLSVCILFDTMFIGRSMGDLGLASLNIALPAYNLFNGIGLTFGVGGATALAVSIGQNKFHRINRIFTTSLIYALTLALCINILQFLFIDKIVYMLGASEVTFTYAKEYLNVILIFNSIFIISYALPVFIRSDNNPKLVMYAIILGNVTNIILDFIFIFPLDLGMFGAALATSIAQVINILILLLHFITKKNTMRFELKSFRIKGIRRIILNGLPSLVTEFSAGFVIYIFNIMIYKFQGDLGVSAYGIITNISLIFIAVFNGAAQGVQPLISINHGANKKERVDKLLKLARIIVFTFGLVFFILGLLFPEQLISMFTEDTGVLMSIATKGIHIYFISFLFNGLNILNMGYLQAIEKGTEASFISSLRGLILVIIFLITLPNLFGVIGVWLTIPIAEIITLVIFYVILALKNKKYLNKLLKS